MAQRLSKGIDTSKLPSVAELMAQQPQASSAQAIEALTGGLTSGFELSSKLADRQIQRQQSLMAIQETIRKAKEAALQSKREQDISAELSGTTPAATRVAANIGGTPVLAKETQQFQEDAPVRLKSVMASADPKGTADSLLQTEEERLRSERDAQEAIDLQNLKFKQAKELQGLKDKGKKSGGKIPVSLINDKNLIENQKKQLDEIENALAPMNKATGQREFKNTGAAGFTKNVLSKVTLGNVGGADLRLYQQNKPATSVSLYRALTGDTRLSDADAKARALPLLPTPGEPKEVQRKKIAYIREGLSRRERILNQVAEMAKSNDFDQSQLDALMVSPLPVSGQEEGIDPAQFIEE